MLFKLIPLLLSITLPTALCATHDIVAGDDGKLAFVPNVTHASPGDTLIFHFYPGHHNVAQGAFNQPCQPSPGGFYSGYIDPDQGESKTTFEVKVNSTDPLWIYCGAPAHCEAGMVGVINPPYVLPYLLFLPLSSPDYMASELAFATT
jgi:plastocyanin